MRITARLLSFILCFELIIGGYGPSVLMSSIAMAEDCPAGTSMDATLNRCLTSNQVAAIKMAVASCTSGTTEEQQKCYQNNAQAALDSQVNAGNAKNNNTNLGQKSNLLKVGSAAAIAVPLFLLTRNLFKKKDQRMICKPASLMLMYAGAGVLLGGEVFTYFQHKSRLKDMSDRWKEITTPVSTASADTQKVQQTEAQSQAFEFLAQNEESIAKTANTKFVYYAAAAGMFAAGTVMAVVEKVKLSTALIAINNPLSTADQKVLAQKEVQRITCNQTQGQKTAADKAAEDEKTKKEEADKVEAANKDNATKVKEKETNIKNATDAVTKSTKKLDLAKLATEAAKTALNNAIKPGDKKSAEIDLTKAKEDEEKAKAENDRLQEELDKLNGVKDPAEGDGGDPGEDYEGTSGLIDYRKFNNNELKNEIYSLTNFKLKKVAQANLEQSNNAYELIELSSELENIQFENYSKISNFEDSEIAHLKDFTFNDFTKSLLNSTFSMNTAHASDLIKKPEIKVDTKPTNTKSGIEEIFSKIFSNPNKTATGDAKTALASTGDQVDKAIGKPLTRAAINGVFGTWIGIMSADFKEQANISKKRADVLRGMKDEFASNGGITNCTDAQRNSTTRTDCYCYTSAGQRNPARSNSAICQKLWGTFSSSSTDYLAESSKVCLDLNSNVDPSCACRTQKGADGKNTCLKASAASFNISGLSTGSFKMLNAGTSAAADLTSGVASAASINGAASLSNAMRVKAAADNMLKSSDPAAALAVKKMSDGIASNALASTAGLTMGGNDSGSSLANMTPAQAVKSLDEELKKGTTQNITTSGSSESIGGGNEPTEKLEFGMTADDLAIQEDQIAEVMNKDLDMGSADINKGSDTNLFEVLSNRYQRSGMRRLFDADGKTKADEPAKSDINQ